MDAHAAALGEPAQKYLAVVPTECLRLLVNHLHYPLGALRYLHLVIRGLLTLPTWHLVIP